MDQSKVVAALLMAGAVALGAPANAAPLTPMSAAAKPQATSTDVVQARFGGWGGGWHGGGWGRGWHGGGWGWGLGAALAGAAIGAAVTAPYWGGYDPYYYDTGYPAYGYGYGYPAYTYSYAAVPAITVVRPAWRRHYGWYHRPYWRSRFAWGW